MPEQLREVELQGLVEQAQVIPIPVRHRRIQGLEDLLDLDRGRGQELPAVLAVQGDHGR